MATPHHSLLATVERRLDALCGVNGLGSEKENNDGDVKKSDDSIPSDTFSDSVRELVTTLNAIQGDSEASLFGHATTKVLAKSKQRWTVFFKDANDGPPIEAEITQRDNTWCDIVIIKTFRTDYSFNNIAGLRKILDTKLSQTESEYMLGRLKATAALERELASMVKDIELYHLLDSDRAEHEKRQRNIQASVNRMNTTIQTMPEFSLEEGIIEHRDTREDDNDFLLALQADTAEMGPLLKELYKKPDDKHTSDHGYVRLQPVCTAFDHHLAALRRFYKTFATHTK